MRFATSLAAFCLAALTAHAVHAETISELVRQAAKNNGLLPIGELQSAVDDRLVGVGRQLFESKNLSLNGDISCRTCHLQQFGSADGIPNAIGVGGDGEGLTRGKSGGAVIPRNTLPLWGRGGPGFDILFWDGKVDFSGDTRVSQFGHRPPSEDPLVTAVHLPVVEIREMLVEDREVYESKREELAAASKLYGSVMERLKRSEKGALADLAGQVSVVATELEFIHVARAIAHFIRDEFRLQPTRFHQFVFENGTLSEEELRGALVFYGKGKCATCHSGPYFTDFAFHAIPMPQIGFGKNGFGVDYGRYNVTHDPADLYKFRTPPLFNVEETAPYGHSGSVASLDDAIRFHFDPLPLLDTQTMAPLDRHEMYKRLAVAGDNMLRIGFLNEDDVSAVEAFLGTLSFKPR